MVFVQEVSDSFWDFEHGNQGVKALADLSVRIGKQVKRQLVRLSEFFMCQNIIPADSKDRHFHVFEFTELIPEFADFCGTSLSKVFRIKEQNQRAAEVVFELKNFV